MELAELRCNFELMARSCKFDIELNSHGEYKSSGRNTYMLWSGYWQCAVDNGLLSGDAAHIDNKDNKKPLRE